MEKIDVAQPNDLEELFQIYSNAKHELEKNGIFQWTTNYPTISIIENDLRKGVLYILKIDNEIIGTVNISEEQEDEYQSIDWKFDNSKILVIHRLVVNPKHQRNGFAKKLMDFAENFSKENNYGSIRLDAYSKNKSVIEFYKKRNYIIRGDVNFPERKHSFHCMEKKIINKTNLNKWVEIELQKCPQNILERIGKIEIQQQIIEEVEQNLNYCKGDGIAKIIFNFANVKGTSIEDYRYRKIKTPLGEMITSIRFIGGDLNKPAVFLIHKDFDLNQVKDIQLIGQIILKEYVVFKPKRIRWYSSTIENDLIENNDFIDGDLVYVTGFIDELKQQPLPKHFDQLELNVAISLDWYDEYKNDYDTICKNWPAFVEMGQIESKETLLDLMQRKLLFEVRKDGKLAGIIGANNGSQNFLSGYYIVEEFLFQDFRGQHLAPAVQRHLIEKLPSNANEMLFGTIHYHNLPSLKTARRTGRKPMGMYIFAEI